MQYRRCGRPHRNPHPGQAGQRTHLGKDATHLLHASLLDSANQHDHIKRKAELSLALWIGPKLQQFSSGAGSYILASYLMLELPPRNTG